MGRTFLAGPAATRGELWVVNLAGQVFKLSAL
jgi:hypothetical protein